ncbi:unnamed protein product [Arabidopsis arenosa]|uniref:Uncharacterized protein n=1 Tax=Arabidopsis arenosa TaxID=38785 RepID=A0A8S2ALI2_ARAAE|nr:unnamed protein product [Arabidopsis arenosa]
MGIGVAEVDSNLNSGVEDSAEGYFALLQMILPSLLLVQLVNPFRRGYISLGVKSPSPCFHGSFSILHATFGTIIEEELGGPVESFFSQFSQEIVAAASFGFQSSENRAVESAIPQVALQALAFLSENTAAQSFVNSFTCLLITDCCCFHCVWDAVMENKDLMKFLQTILLLPLKLNLTMTTNLNVRARRSVKSWKLIKPMELQIFYFHF